MIINSDIGFKQQSANYISSFFEVTLNSSYITNSVPFIYYPLSLAPHSFWNRVTSDGGNIRVYNPANNRVPIEVIYIDKLHKDGAIHIHSSDWLDTTSNQTIKISTSSFTDVMEDSTSTYGSYNVYDTDNYILHYNLTGPNALKNRVSNNYHLTSIGTVTTDQTSPIEGYTSHSYDGTSGYDYYNDSTSGAPWALTTWPITVECVSKCNSTSVEMDPLSLSNASTFSSVICLRYRGDATEQVEVSSVGTNGVESAAVSSASLYTAGQWTYMSGTRDANSGVGKLYLNDSTTAIASNTTTISTAALTNVSLGNIVRTSNMMYLNGGNATSLVSNIVRPPEYFYTRFNNLFRPDVFFIRRGCTLYDTGYVLGGIATNVTGANPDWTNPSNALVDSTSKATCVTNDENSDILRITNFGFTIPSNATILGYMVKIRRIASVSSTIQDALIKFVLSGTESGDNKIGGVWLNTLVTKEYGADIDTWNTSFIYSNLNNSGFGIDIQVLNTDTVNSTASIEAVWIKVFYQICS